MLCCSLPRSTNRSSPRFLLRQITIPSSSTQQMYIFPEPSERGLCFLSLQELCWRMHLRESGLWGVLHAAEAVGGKARAQAERGTHPRTGGRSLGSQVPSYPGKPTLLKCKYLLTSHQVLKIVNCRETTALSHSMSSLGTDQIQSTGWLNWF